VEGGLSSLAQKREPKQGKRTETPTATSSIRIQPGAECSIGGKHDAEKEQYGKKMRSGEKIELSGGGYWFRIRGGYHGKSQKKRQGQLSSSNGQRRQRHGQAIGWWKSENQRTKKRGGEKKCRGFGTGGASSVIVG